MTNSPTETETETETAKAKPKSKRIGASPASNDWDPGPVADQKLINALKSKVVASTIVEDDPLEEKHKGQAYRRDFRTVDYKRLSKTEDEKAAERQRIKAMHSTWVPLSKSGKSARPSTLAKFASFGGSTISVDVIRLKKGERSRSGSTDHSADGQPRSALAMPIPDASDETAPKAQTDDARFGGGMAVGEEPILLEHPREGSAIDPLTDIDGIGPSIERLLHELGVFHFDQIAGWTGPQVAWIENALACESGRIEKEGWVGSAIRLRAR
ncbi:hypothetical protein U0C82_10480 [Fulvimarina sp. 2208YS6-2-32]|uniref:NADH-quinone oxidoreductase subunit E n=1 Tax=Fulvimarina uroteuthidis TaxID=3098149 RepID=A0ABU5I3M1_9HYPH|nr:hypothetical protein [Fulvimarina sp. 2208YS6-2-32]MDY8109563.1 hypothetical protein [Fulvimarina sp. 2208YS6-2-32]